MMRTQKTMAMKTETASPRDLKKPQIFPRMKTCQDPPGMAAEGKSWFGLMYWVCWMSLACSVSLYVNDFCARPKARKS